MSLAVLEVLKNICKRAKGKNEEETVRIFRAAIRNLPETQDGKAYLANDWFFLEDAIRRCWRLHPEINDEELPHVLATKFFDAPRPQWKTFLASRKKIDLSQS
jgi:hypothetical protein